MKGVQISHKLEDDKITITKNSSEYMNNLTKLMIDYKQLNKEFSSLEMQSKFQKFIISEYENTLTALDLDPSVFSVASISNKTKEKYQLTKGNFDKLRNSCIRLGTLYERYKRIAQIEQDKIIVINKDLFNYYSNDRREDNIDEIEKEPQGEITHIGIQCNLIILNSIHKAVQANIPINMNDSLSSIDDPSHTITTLKEKIKKLKSLNYELTKASKESLDFEQRSMELFQQVQLLKKKSKVKEDQGIAYEVKLLHHNDVESELKRIIEQKNKDIMILKECYNKHNIEITKLKERLNRYKEMEATNAKYYKY